MVLYVVIVTVALATWDDDVDGRNELRRTRTRVATWKQNLELYTLLFHFIRISFVKMVCFSNKMSTCRQLVQRLTDG